MPEDIDAALRSLDVRIRKQEIWASGHEARINTQWSEQVHINKELKSAVDNIAIRTHQLERRFVFMMAFASGFGSLVGISVPLLIFAWQN